MPTSSLFFNILGPAEVLSMNMISRCDDDDGVTCETRLRLRGQGSATGYEVFLYYNSLDEGDFYSKTVVKRIPVDFDKLVMERMAGRSTVSLKHVPGDRVEQMLVYYGEVPIAHMAYIYDLEDGYMNAPNLMGTVEEETKNIIGVPMEYEEENIREGWTSRHFHNPEMMSHYQEQLDDKVEAHELENDFIIYPTTTHKPK